MERIAKSADLAEVKEEEMTKILRRLHDFELELYVRGALPSIDGVLSAAVVFFFNWYRPHEYPDGNKI